MAHTPAAPPRCLAPLKEVTRPDPALPEGSCDAHAHVIDDAARHMLVAQRDYTPAPAPLAAYCAMHRQLGIARGVVIQPSIYGTDNRLLLETVAPRQDRLRAVVVIAPDTPRQEVARMHEAGARGFRINLLFQGGAIDLDALESLAALSAPFGWHAQLLIDITSLDEALEQRLRALPVPVVFDHMGHFPGKHGIDFPGFRAMVRLAEEGRAWIKLSGAYRLSTDAPDYRTADIIAKALVGAVPERLVWGSDWPHVGLNRHMPDTGLLAGAMARWCENTATRRRILIDNPSRLYGFPPWRKGQP